MEKVKYGIHHQAVADCPQCGTTCVEDLGEDDIVDEVEMQCPACDCEFELEGLI